MLWRRGGRVRLASEPRSISCRPVIWTSNQAIVDGRAERSTATGWRISPLGLVISTCLLRDHSDVRRAGQRRHVISENRISKPWPWQAGSGSPYAESAALSRTQSPGDKLRHSDRISSPPVLWIDRRRRVITTRCHLMRSTDHQFEDGARLGG